MTETAKTKTLYNLEYIKKVMKKGFDWCIRLAVFSIIAAVVVDLPFGLKNNLLQFMGFDRFALFDGVIILIIGYGIYVKSRVVTGIGFTFYILERTYMWFLFWSELPLWPRPLIHNFFVIIIVVIVFIASMKSIGIYNELRKSYVVKKNIFILNILALLYSFIVTTAILFIADYFSKRTFTELIIRDVTYSEVNTALDAWILSYTMPVLICCVAVTYVFTLTKHLPFTRDRDMFRYELSEDTVVNVKLKGKYYFPAIYHAIVPVIIIVYVLFFMAF